MNKLSFFVLLLLLIKSSYLYADSPITTTFFYSAYYEIPEVQNAEREGVLTYENASFLSSKRPIDQKVALINALGWSISSKNNMNLYEIFLKKKYNTGKLDYLKLTPDEHLCLGYLCIMDNYFLVRKPLDILKTARRRNPKSYTYNIIYALVLSQLMVQVGDNYYRGMPFSDTSISNDVFDYSILDSTSSSYCNVYLSCVNIENDKSLIQDFRASAKACVFSYLSDYKKDCKNEKLVLIPSVKKLETLTSDKVKLSKESGVYNIPVSINDGIVFDFIFDSGASDLTISRDVFEVLLKQKKISTNDIIGYSNYQIADGSIIKKAVLNLKKVQIGNFVVNNVRASVGDYKTPLLLGQSFLEKFEYFTIDYEESTLKLSPLRRNNNK